MRRELTRIVASFLAISLGMTPLEAHAFRLDALGASQLPKQAAVRLHLEALSGRPVSDIRPDGATGNPLITRYWLSPLRTFTSLFSSRYASGKALSAGAVTLAGVLVHSAHAAAQSAAQVATMPLRTASQVSQTLIEHTIQRGDSLWKIARLYNLDSWQSLQRVNDLSNPELIIAGKKLFVPVQTLASESIMPLDQAAGFATTVAPSPAIAPATGSYFFTPFFDFLGSSASALANWSQSSEVLVLMLAAGIVGAAALTLNSRPDLIQRAAAYRPTASAITSYLQQLHQPAPTHPTRATPAPATPKVTSPAPAAPTPTLLELPAGERMQWGGPASPSRRPRLQNSKKEAGAPLRLTFAGPSLEALQQKWEEVLTRSYPSRTAARKARMDFIKGHLSPLRIDADDPERAQWHTFKRRVEENYDVRRAGKVRGSWQWKLKKATERAPRRKTQPAKLRMTLETPPVGAPAPKTPDLPSLLPTQASAPAPHQDPTDEMRLVLAEPEPQPPATQEVFSPVEGAIVEALRTAQESTLLPLFDSRGSETLVETSSERTAPLYRRLHVAEPADTNSTNPLPAAAFEVTESLEGLPNAPVNRRDALRRHSATSPLRQNPAKEEMENAFDHSQARADRLSAKRAIRTVPPKAAKPPRAAPPRVDIYVPMVRALLTQRLFAVLGKLEETKRSTRVPIVEARSEEWALTPPEDDFKLRFEDVVHGVSDALAYQPELVFSFEPSALALPFDSEAASEASPEARTWVKPGLRIARRQPITLPPLRFQAVDITPPQPLAEPQAPEINFENIPPFQQIKMARSGNEAVQRHLDAKGIRWRSSAQPVPIAPAKASLPLDERPLAPEEEGIVSVNGKSVAEPTLAPPRIGLMQRFKSIALASLWNWNGSRATREERRKQALLELAKNDTSASALQEKYKRELATLIRQTLSSEQRDASGYRAFEAALERLFNTKRAWLGSDARATIRDALSAYRKDLPASDQQAVHSPKPVAAPPSAAPKDDSVQARFNAKLDPLGQALRRSDLKAPFSGYFRFKDNGRVLINEFRNLRGFDPDQAQIKIDQHLSAYRALLGVKERERLDTMLRVKDLAPARHVVLSDEDHPAAQKPLPAAQGADSLMPRLVELHRQITSDRAPAQDKLGTYRVELQRVVSDIEAATGKHMMSVGNGYQQIWSQIGVLLIEYAEQIKNTDSHLSKGKRLLQSTVLAHTSSKYLSDVDQWKQAAERLRISQYPAVQDMHRQLLNKTIPWMNGGSGPAGASAAASGTGANSFMRMFMSIFPEAFSGLLFLSYLLSHLGSEETRFAAGAGLLFGGASLMALNNRSEEPSKGLWKSLVTAFKKREDSAIQSQPAKHATAPARPAPSASRAPAQMAQPLTRPSERKRVTAPAFWTSFDLIASQLTSDPHQWQTYFSFRNAAVNLLKRSVINNDITRDDAESVKARTETMLREFWEQSTPEAQLAIDKNLRALSLPTESERRAVSMPQSASLRGFAPIGLLMFSDVSAYTWYGGVTTIVGGLAMSLLVASATYLAMRQNTMSRPPFGRAASLLGSMASGIATAGLIITLTWMASFLPASNGDTLSTHMEAPVVRESPKEPETTGKSPATDAPLESSMARDYAAYPLTASNPPSLMVTEESPAPQAALAPKAEPAKPAPAAEQRIVVPAIHHPQKLLGSPVAPSGPMLTASRRTGRFIIGGLESSQADFIVIHTRRQSPGSIPHMLYRLAPGGYLGSFRDVVSGGQVLDLRRMKSQGLSKFTLHVDPANGAAAGINVFAQSYLLQKPISSRLIDGFRMLASSAGSLWGYIFPVLHAEPQEAPAADLTALKAKLLEESQEWYRRMKVAYPLLSRGINDPEYPLLAHTEREIIYEQETKVIQTAIEILKQDMAALQGWKSPVLPWNDIERFMQISDPNLYKKWTAYKAALKAKPASRPRTHSERGAISLNALAALAALFVPLLLPMVGSLFLLEGPVLLTYMARAAAGALVGGGLIYYFYGRHTPAASHEGRRAHAFAASA